MYRKARSEESKKQWNDPLYRAKLVLVLKKNGVKTAKTRFLTICRSTKSRYGEITKSHYDVVRSMMSHNLYPRFEWGVAQFPGGIQDVIKIAKTEQEYLNHKVISVKPAGVADVYDLTVDITHNFALAAGVFVHNSVDGDSAAAMRYTEVRLSRISEELLADIDKETVTFIDNFDGSQQEPTVLPARLPNLLLMGAEGIAVGMATKIPPHNLTEVFNGLAAMIEQGKTEKLEGKTTPTKEEELQTANPAVLAGSFQSEITIEQLMEHIKGPDFPTGGVMYDWNQIKEGYAIGRGRIVVRAVASIEETKTGKFQIIITELPYQVNKAKLVAKIAQLVRDKRLVGISDLRDESDREGLRVVVELKKDA
ncbi:MAG: DNA gyrase subunit A, partial [Patescibacteria group bacterium]